RAMSDDCVTKKCHTQKKMMEGSEIVMIGQGMKPMTRRRDRTMCGGKIAKGIDSIIVGGTPSAEGKEIEEEDSHRVGILSAVWDLLSGGSTMAKGGAKNIARGAAQIGAVGL